MARPSPHIEDQPGSPERSSADWLVRLQNKAKIKVGADSGAAYDAELTRLRTAYARLITLP